MLKLLFLSVFTAGVCAANLDWIQGRWLPVALYPNVIYEPICQWMEVSKGTAPCSCGDRPAVDVVHFYYAEKNKTETQAAIVVSKYDEVESIIALNCTCEGYERIAKPHALQKLNDDTFVKYTEQSWMSMPGMKEPNMAVVAVRSVPTLRRLRDVMHSVEQLKARRAALLCEPNVFKNENTTST